MCTGKSTNDDEVRRGNLGESTGTDRQNAPTETVSNNRAPDLLRHDHTEAWPIVFADDSIQNGVR